MASENISIDENGRWGFAGVTNDSNQFILNGRINPVNNRLIVEGHVTSSNTSIGDVIPGGTEGSVLFLGVGGTLAQDNANFFWDDMNIRLGLGTDTPAATLDVEGTTILNDGSAVVGYVWTATSTDGAGTWMPASSGGSGITSINGDTTAAQTLSDAIGGYITIVDVGSGSHTFAVDIAGLTSDSTFISDVATSLIADTTFLSDLANSSTFVTDLIANTTFTTDLANDSNFYTTLAGNTSFISDLTSNSTFQSDITTITTTNGAITVEDEGTPLATAAAVLNFVGAGVTATGSGTTKTITIPGGVGTGIISRGNDNNSISGTLYTSSQGAARGTPDEACNVMSGTTTLGNFIVVTPTNIAIGDTVFTVYQNGSPTAVTVTIPSGSTTPVQDVSDTISVVAGDLISVEVAVSGGGAVTTSWSYTLN